MIRNLPAEHQQLVARLKTYEKKLAPQIAKAEESRKQAIATAQGALSAHEQQIADSEAKLDQKHKQTLATAEAKLKSYEANIGQQAIRWAASSDKTTQWTVLDPDQVSSTSATTLKKQKDLSVVATSSNGLGTYNVVAHTNLKGIRAVRLEVLSDPQHPKKGPGRSPDGNFVLTEFELDAAPKSDPTKSVKVKLAKARATFSQAGYSVASAIDGRMAASLNGWAISPKIGVNHAASFQTQQPIGFSDGTVLTFRLHQQFQSGQHSIGRFRLSVTTSSGPLMLRGLPEKIAAITKIAPSKRNAAQKAELLTYYRSIDGELRRLNSVLAEAKKPRQVPIKLQQLRKQLATVSQPLPVDAALRRLRADVGLSEQQLKNVRLTAAQDLTWALINSPAFLFNR